jgi:hypothetical protein
MPEDKLVERLKAFSRDVSDSARLAPAGAVRTRGDRRKIQLTGVTAITAGVLTATVGVAVSATGGGGGGAAAGGLATMIPNELDLPHEGESGWTRDDNAQITGVFQPCTGHDASLSGRTDARTMTGRGSPIEEEHSPTAITNQLFLYGSEQDATAVMDSLATDMTRCGWMGGWTRQTVYGQHVLMGRSGDQPLLDAIAIRRGNVVYVSYLEIGGALMSSGDYPAVEEMGRRLCTVLDLCEPEMCYYPAPSPSEMVGVPCVSGSPLVPPPTFPQICIVPMPSPTPPFEATCPPDPTVYPSSDPSSYPTETYYPPPSPTP